MIKSMSNGDFKDRHLKFNGSENPIIRIDNELAKATLVQGIEIDHSAIHIVAKMQIFFLEFSLIFFNPKYVKSVNGENESIETSACFGPI